MTYSGSTVTPFLQNEQVMVAASSSGQHKTSAIMISEQILDSFSMVAAYTVKSPHVAPSAPGTSRRALLGLTSSVQKLQGLSTGAGQHKGSAPFKDSHKSDSLSMVAAYTVKSLHVAPSAPGTLRRALPALSPLGQKLQGISAGAGQHKGSTPFTLSHESVPSSIVACAVDIRLAQVAPPAPGITESGSAVMPSEHTEHILMSIVGLAEFVGWSVIGDAVGDSKCESTAHSLDAPNARSNSPTLSKS
mmetsp:Transcript_29740/g.54606  ORF Transcript_29740/g.54606 Transcript_29740/m.54606 type:complete len:247 (-) Transcript_29740:1680-2420(-)